MRLLQNTLKEKSDKKKKKRQDRDGAAEGMKANQSSTT
jgi:hypothetical protein